MIKKLIFFLLLANTCCAVELKLNPQQSSVEFVATGSPSMLKIKGKDAHPEGFIRSDAKSTVGKINLNLDAFSTGLAKRDEHMKTQYLETKTYPKAVLEITQITPALMVREKSGTYAGRLVGKLTLHGVTKPIQAPLRLDWRDNGFTADTNFSINLSDYSIKVPSFAGITVANSVEILAHTAGSLAQ